MSFSLLVKSRKGTSVRTPISRQMSVISDHIRLFQGATAPSSMVRESSGTRVLSSTVITVPVPLQVRQAPWLLKANSSAESARTLAPHTGQTSGFSAATARLGSSQWPHCGQG